MPKESHIVRLNEDFRVSYRLWERLEDGGRAAAPVQSADFAMYHADHVGEEEYLVVSGSAEVDGNEVSFLLTQGAVGEEPVNGGSAVAGLYEGRFTVDLGEETRKHYMLIEVRTW